MKEEKTECEAFFKRLAQLSKNFNNIGCDANRSTLLRNNNFSINEINLINR